MRWVTRWVLRWVTRWKRHAAEMLQRFRRVT
jgi:hypothetical protein